MTNAFENVGKSFSFGFSTCVKNILRWLILTIVSIIPIVNFLAAGIYLKVFRNEEPDFSNAGKAFIQGLLEVIICIIYAIIPAIVSFLFTQLLPLGIVGYVISVVVSLIFILIGIPATVNFARKEKFGAAFQFSEIMGMIKSAPTLNYLVSYLVLIILFAIIGFVIGLIGSILAPVAVVIGIIILVPMALFGVKYFDTVFH